MFTKTKIYIEVLTTDPVGDRTLRDLCAQLDDCWFQKVNVTSTETLTRKRAENYMSKHGLDPEACLPP